MNPLNKNEENHRTAAASPAFPRQVHQMLEDAETQGFDHIVGWQQGGRSFKVYQQDAFAHSTMRIYFSQTKFKSFQRQRKSNSNINSLRYLVPYFLTSFHFVFLYIK
jgi:hypothetical protein